MLTIAKLFGKSPFAPLQTHMGKVADCVGELPNLFAAIIAQDLDLIEKIAQTISTLEHEADITKNDIRNHLPRSLFLPVDRGNLLEILSLQDSIADSAEEVARLAQILKLPLLGNFPEFKEFCSKNVETFWLARKAILELEELLESSFGGIEAQKVKGLVEQIAFSEYESTLLQNSLITKLYRSNEEVTVAVFHLVFSLIEKIGQLAQVSEKLGNRVRMLLELK